MNTQTNFSIQKNNCSNIEELISLSETYYKEGDIINKEYLEWQYLNNPGGKPFLFTSREENSGELAGQYLVIPKKYSVKNNVVSGSLSLNTLTHPKYQGKGLFTKMAKATFEDCEENNSFFTIGFPNPLSYPGFVKKLNFEHLGDIPLLIRPLKPLNIFFSYFKKNKKKHGGYLILPSIEDKNKRIKLFDFNDSELENKYQTFWGKIRPQYDVSTLKDYSFLKWRYSDLPTRDYNVYYYESNNEIEGIVVVKAEHVWGFNVGILMDFLVLNNDKKVGGALLKCSKKVFRKCNLDFIASLHSNSNEYSILKSSGYFTVPKKILPQKIHFIVRENKKFSNSDLLFDLKNWKLTFGDYDIF